MCDTRLESVTGLCDPTSNAFTSDQLIEVANRDALPFRHEGCIGRGSSAIIEKVSHKFTKERFALKTFRRAHTRHFANDKRAFENEVSIMKRLSSHKHIIQVRGSFICNRELSILMSPVASDGDLAAVIARVFDSGMTDEQNVILNRAFGCLASGLAFIHKHTIRHKDIKPQNILVHDGRVIYTDFGISFDAEEKDTTTIGFTDTFTRRYCAPEVRDFANRNRKSDVYCLGCVFVEIMDVLEPEIGLRSMDGLPYYEKLEQLRQLLVNSSVTGRARQELFRICYDMLEPDPADRIDTSSVLHRIIRLGNLKDSPKVGLFCDDCSDIAEPDDIATQEELVDDSTLLSVNVNQTTTMASVEAEIEGAAQEELVEDSTVLSLDANPTTDTVSPEAEIEGATQKELVEGHTLLSLNANSTAEAVSSGVEIEGATQEELVEGGTVLPLEANPTTDTVSPEAEIEGAPKEATKKGKNKGVVSSIDLGERSEPISFHGASSFATPRYYCTACGELGHKSSKCPNKCWACGELYHKSADCPNKCWTCNVAGHFARDCPNECDACGKIGHPTNECPNRCWTCGEVGHFWRGCKDECFVCGRVGHGTWKCKGKCHKCGKIGHWRKNCNDACGECGELGHKVAQCPSKKKMKKMKQQQQQQQQQKKKERSGDVCSKCSDPGHIAAQCPKKRGAWRPIFDQVPQGPYRPEPRRRN